MAEEKEHDYDLMTLREAAEYSGYSYGYLRQLAAEGKIRTVRVGYQHLVTRREAERLRRLKMEQD